MAELENTNLTNNIDNGVSGVMTDRVNPNLFESTQAEVSEQSPLQEGTASQMGYETQNSETAYQESVDTLQNQGMIQIPEISQNEVLPKTGDESQIQEVSPLQVMNQEPVQIPAVYQNEGEWDSEWNNQSNPANEAMVTIPNLSNDMISIGNESNNTNSEQISEAITPSTEVSEENQQNVVQSEPTNSAEAPTMNVDIQVQNSKNEQQEKLVKIIKLREWKAKKVWFSMWMLTGIIVIALVGVASVIFAKDQIINLLQNWFGNNPWLSANVVDLSDNNQIDENVVIDEENIEEDNEDIAESDTDFENQWNNDESQLREIYLDQLNSILAMWYDNQSTIRQLNEMLQEVKSYENPDQELISLIVGEIEYFEAEMQKESWDNEDKDNKWISDENIANVGKENNEKSDESLVKNEDDKELTENETNVVNNEDSQQDVKSKENKDDSHDESEIANSSGANNETVDNQQDNENIDNEEVESNEEKLNGYTPSNSEWNNEINEQNADKIEASETTDGVITYFHVDNPENANRVMSPNCSSLSCGDYTQTKKENLVLCKSFQLKEDMDDSSHRISNSGVCRYKDASELVYLDM